MSWNATKLQTTSPSDSVREHARVMYLEPAVKQGLQTFSINVGQVHRALGLKNRIPLVCQALKSEKFLESNQLRLISETGPPSGQSTTVTYTYEFIASAERSARKTNPWHDLRGSLKSVFADLGGGDNYLRREREAFESKKESR